LGIFGEFLLILLVTAAGVLVSSVPGFPLPGSVTGMLIMLVLLLSGLIKLSSIRRASDILIKFLPLFFIPLIVNIIREGGLVSRYGSRIAVVIISTTIITLAVTGLTAKMMIHLTGKSEKGTENG
jgi:holin-like protein